MNRALLARVAKLESIRRTTPGASEAFGLTRDQMQAAACAWLQCRREGVEPAPPPEFDAAQREGFAQFCEAVEDMEKIL